MKRAIVLSGGGSKGAYQIGVWKALRKLNIRYDIVTGTSVGALNAALMVQKNYLKSILFWKNLSFKDVIDEKIEDDIENKELYKKYFKGALKGGMTIDNLESTINKALDVKKVYSSDVDLGIVTFKLKGLTPTLIRKNRIKPKKLKDYLVASASCYPAFHKKNIDGEDYIDGGIYDNLPINLAIEMGATEVIAVDLKEIGIKQKVKNEEIPITYITPNNDIGSFLVFEKNLARRNIRFGYNDAMKEFKVLEGNKYTFKHNSLNRNYQKKYDYFKKSFDEHTMKSTILKKLSSIGIYKRIFSEREETRQKEFYKLIEFLGEIFEIDESYIYRVSKFNRLLLKNFSLVTDKMMDNYLNEHKFKMIFSNKITIKYLYSLINDNKVDKYILMFPKEFLGALYLKTIIDNKDIL